MHITSWKVSPAKIVKQLVGKIFMFKPIRKWYNSHNIT